MCATHIANLVPARRPSVIVGSRGKEHKSFHARAGVVADVIDVVLKSSLQSCQLFL